MNACYSFRCVYMHMSIEFVYIIGVIYNKKLEAFIIEVVITPKFNSNVCVLLIQQLE